MGVGHFNILENPPNIANVGTLVKIATNGCMFSMTGRTIAYNKNTNKKHAVKRRGHFDLKVSYFRDADRFQWW